MIAGHLQIKNDNYYMVLNYTDANGKRRQPWIPTGLPAKGNKRRAEKLLLDTRKSFVPPVVSKENEDISSDMLFADYMELWLEIIRSSVEKTTFSSYTQMVKGKIAPYFRNTGLTLDGIQAKHIQSFYLHELKTVSPGTVIHYHANIHKALKYAVKMDLIPFNPRRQGGAPQEAAVHCGLLPAGGAGEAAGSVQGSSVLPADSDDRFLRIPSGRSVGTEVGRHRL